MTQGTTQEAYATLLRDHIGPALRALGFKGSRGAYTADRREAFVNLGFQRSAFGDRTRADFTINVTVAPVAEWNAARAAHPVLGRRPAASGFYLPHLFGTGAWQARIGHLMPDGRDHWWMLTPESDVRALAEEVITALTAFAVPAIEAHLPRNPDM
ncbi:MAG: DUF4304 domain-containing protein [Chloroflexota bacterium]